MTRTPTQAGNEQRLQIASIIAPEAFIIRSDGKYVYPDNVREIAYEKADAILAALRPLPATDAVREALEKIRDLPPTKHAGNQAATIAAEALAGLLAGTIDADWAADWQYDTPSSRAEARAAIAQFPAPADRAGLSIWRPYIGEPVKMADHVDDAHLWNTQSYWIAGIRVADNGDGMEITVSEQWPIPNRHFSGYLGQTDGFHVGRSIKPDDLLPLTPPATRAEPSEEGARWRPEVVAFADLMEAQLRANDHKPGWKGDSPEALYRRVQDESHELGELLLPGSRTNVETWSRQVGAEAADIANMAMMVADVCGSLRFAQQTDSGQGEGGNG